ncbi:hypothetical protein CEXT_404761 [Caerostris extrusa]|uniref:Uncharacterized protein n=1 Tax=Caerostris extrusa TaxID=172846 RepID=A0AAV4SST8_CAEEX|nr:hypothetical protein CEXT_404761 [Caerostris extrusa]
MTILNSSVRMPFELFSSMSSSVESYPPVTDFKGHFDHGFDASNVGQPFPCSFRSPRRPNVRKNKENKGYMTNQTGGSNDSCHLSNLDLLKSQLYHLQDGATSGIVVNAVG